MRNKYFIWVLAALAVTVIPFTAALAKTADQVSLIVDQDILTKGEMEESVQSFFLEQGMKPAAPGTREYDAAKKQVIDAFVREVLMAEDADREKIEVQPAEVDQAVNQQIDGMKKSFASEQEFNDSLKKEGISLDDLRQDAHDKLLRRLKANHILRQKQQELPSSVVVTDMEARADYDQHASDYEKVKFAIILFRISPLAKPSEVKQVKTQAQGILDRIKGGEDFAVLAKKYSEDPGSATDGGNVGTVARADIGDPLLSKGVFAIPSNGLGLVKAAEGLYIVKVEKKGKADFESAAADIKAHLKRQKQDSAMNRWIDGLKKNAYIVEDGKVISAASLVSASETGAPASTPVPTASAPATLTAEDVKLFNIRESYPSLPMGGTLAAYFGGEGVLVPTSDLGNYYAPLNTDQTFPFGAGFFGGIEIALDPTLQVGVKGEIVRKFAEKVTDAGGNVEQWDSTAAGTAITAKVIIPMDESTNFILSASGGYYVLMSSSVTVSGTGVNENVNLTGSNFGGEAGGTLEFLLDDHKSTALDIGLGYRFLRFSPLASTVTATGPVTFSSPMLNGDGSNAGVDFAGAQINVGLRFFLDKAPEKDTPAE